MWFRVEGDMKGTCGIHSFLFPYHFELIHWFQPHAPKNLYAAGFDGLKRDAWLGDFAFMRAASHIAISPGTFAWWGAFLGQAARVYFPIPPGPAVLPWCHLFPKLMDGTYLFYDAWNKESFHSASEAAARCGALQGKQNPTRLAPMQLVERLYPEVLAHLQDIGGTQHLQKFGFNGTVTSTAANPKESMGEAANLPAVNHFLVIYSIIFHCLKSLSAPIFFTERVIETDFKWFSDIKAVAEVSKNRKPLCDGPIPTMCYSICIILYGFIIPAVWVVFIAPG